MVVDIPARLQAISKESRRRLLQVLVASATFTGARQLLPESDTHRAAITGKSGRSYPLRSVEREIVAEGPEIVMQFAVGDGSQTTADSAMEDVMAAAVSRAEAEGASTLVMMASYQQHFPGWISHDKVSYVRGVSVKRY